MMSNFSVLVKKAKKSGAVLGATKIANKNIEQSQRLFLLLLCSVCICRQPLTNTLFLFVI